MQDEAEGDLEKRSKNKARAAAWFVRKFKTPARRSAPDDIFIRQKRFAIAVFATRVFFVEFKRFKKAPSPLQEEEHKLMREAGLTVYVCDDDLTFDMILEVENKIFEDACALVATTTR